MTTRKVAVHFSESVYQALVELAEKRGKTMSAALRDAIATEVWLQKEVEQGWRVLLERDGNAREVILR